MIVWSTAANLFDIQKIFPPKWKSVYRRKHRKLMAIMIIIMKTGNFFILQKLLSVCWFVSSHMFTWSRKLMVIQLLSYLLAFKFFLLSHLFSTSRNYGSKKTTILLHMWDFRNIGQLYYWILVFLCLAYVSSQINGCEFRRLKPCMLARGWCVPNKRLSPFPISFYPKTRVALFLRSMNFIGLIWNSSY